MDYAKKHLPTILEHEWFRGSVVALIMIGAALLILGIYQFVDANSLMQQNLSYQRQQAGTDVLPQNQAEAQMLMSADVQYRQLRIQQSNALVFGGAGLAVMALGWLGYDFARAQRRKRQATVIPFQSSAG